MKHIIKSEDIKDIYRSLIERAKYFKSIKKYPNLNKDCFLFFEEPSTRTRVSFEKAAKNLGCNTYYIQANYSSTTKGESLYDTFLSFKEIGADIIIFRTSEIMFEDNFKDIDISIINAGDGTHEHPSQGLLDVFTLLEKVESLENQNILYVGDIYHSRVFRSGAYLFKCERANIGVCSYPSLIPKDYPFIDKVFTNLDEALEWANNVISLRIQKERHKDVLNLSSYFDMYGITKERYKKIKGYLMHPGPVNRNIDIEDSILYEEKSLILNQIQNGVFVRTAMIEYALNE